MLLGSGDREVTFLVTSKNDGFSVLHEQNLWGGRDENIEFKDVRMSASIDYGSLMHRAMRGLIKEVLSDVQSNGLPGNHHFFITFDTHHSDVEIADWLVQRYPDEMTIVVQHEYYDLIVDDAGFNVTMSFGDNPEVLRIPYDSIRTFVDPSVEFGLRFEKQDTDDEEEDEDVVAPLAAVEDEDDVADVAEEEAHDAEVVSLDSFRK